MPHISAKYVTHNMQKRGFKMNPLELLSELEDELRDKRGILRKDGGRMLAIVGQLRESIPLALDEADYIVGKQQQILKNADVVARNTLRAAEERAEHLAGTTEIMRKADIDAKKMLDKTATRCDVLVKKTKEHLDSMFIEAEQFLLSTLTMIRTNREELRDALLIKQKDAYG